MINQTIGEAKPSTGHEVIAALVKRGHVARVITQNIDGLHETAGVPRDRIIEIHGNGTYAACLSCGCATRSTGCGTSSQHGKKHPTAPPAAAS